MSDEIRDRGTKKWTSIMLPEHVEALKKMYAEEERKDKPILDEQKKIEIDFLLKAALNNDATVKIQYYADYDYCTVEGKLLMIDVLGGYLKIEHNDLEDVYLQDILDVSIL